jgi:hypothetical protein
MALRADGPVVMVKIGYRSYSERTWNCYCDFCGKKALKSGTFPGDSDVEARKEGWITVSCGLTAPRKWVCPECQVKRIASGKASPANGVHKNGVA